MIARLRIPSTWRSLSGRLLVLTVCFVMLAEIFIYLPSIARYRLDYLRDRLASAYLATLTLEATPDKMVGPELQRKLLEMVNARMIVRRTPGEAKRVLMGPAVPAKMMLVDLRDPTVFGQIGEAWATLSSTGNRPLRVIGPSPGVAGTMMEVILDERPVRRAMIAYSWRILALSVGISLFTAALVFLALHWVIVRPLRRMTENVVRFAEAPEEQNNRLPPTRRRDEIGVVQNELGMMQGGIRASLRQRERLATLGEAVTKINHDVRNMLASAQLVSDRLSDSDDPQVKKSVPILLRSLDRAVTLCQQTLTYAQPKRDRGDRARYSLAALIVEASLSLPEAAGKLIIERDMPNDMSVVADREQWLRMFENLFRNALQAGASRLLIVGRTGVTSDDIDDPDHDDRDHMVIDIADDGPGVPDSVRANLFQPFKSNDGETKRGTGLGLSIVHDVVAAHGGDIRLIDNLVPEFGGAYFRMRFPAAPDQRR